MNTIQIRTNSDKIAVLFSIVMVLSSQPAAYTQTQTIEHSGYRITVLLTKGADNSVVTVRRGKKMLAKHAEGILADYGSDVELISLLGSKEKQLVISQYTGGNHCCTRYWIYRLNPRFRLLFRSADFETLGYSETDKLFQNLDADPQLEIVDETPAFHYFDNLAFVSSPRPKLIFDYDHKLGRYRLANRNFSSVLIGDSRRWIDQAKAVKESDPNQFAVWMFGISLDYVYAGKADLAQNFYYGNADLKKSKFTHKWKDVLSVLRSDPAYREIYRK